MRPGLTGCSTEYKVTKLYTGTRVREGGNRLKIESAISNARAFLEIQEKFGTFRTYASQFIGGHPKQNRWKNVRDIPATTPVSDVFSKDLKGRGFSFVGSTVVYAHMQATGMVNDHTVDCFRYREIRRLAA